MQLFDNIRLAFSSLWANKLRALLTMLGIIIGIGSVIAIVTLGDSLTGSITDSLQGFGINNITVSLQRKSEDDETTGGAVRMFGMENPSSEDLFTNAMIEEFRTAYPDEIYAIALSQSLASGQVQQDDTTVQVTAMGVNEEYALANNVNLLHGRFVKDSDGERQIAVVSDVFCESVFGTSGASVLGQEFELSVNGQLLRFYVAGVYEYDDDGFVSMTGSDPVTELYLPLEAAQKLSGGETGYQSFTVVASTDTDTTAFLEQVESFFSSFYTRNESYTATASSMESMLEEMTSMLNTVKLAISAIAAISLLVGGIGVMNIMLVSVTERTAEIGLKKAIGAKKKRILMQFLTESAVLTSLGGLIGVISGIIMAQLISSMMQIPVSISFPAIGVAVVFSTLIGVVFGMLPAVQAANLNPIEALRRD